ncbi:MAG: hypothetical protein WKG07_22535 [Hymenobacter sp.]
MEPHVNNLTVPNRLRAEFGEDTLAVAAPAFSLRRHDVPRLLFGR